MLSEAELTAVLQTMMRTKLTEEEAAKKVRKLMDSVDADMDGLVSVEELRRWVRNQARASDVASHAKSLSEAQKKSEKAEKAEKAKAAERQGSGDGDPDGPEAE